MPTYKVVCNTQSGGRWTVKGQTGLSEEQAQSVCRDPETSSASASSAAAVRRTRAYGPWFYGYEQEGGR